MIDDLRRSGSTPEDSTSGADLIARAKAALEGVTDDPLLIHLMDAHDIVGFMSGLVAEVERLRGALDRLKAEWENAAEEEGGELGGPTAGAFYECAASIEAVLRGDQ